MTFLESECFFYVFGFIIRISSSLTASRPVIMVTFVCDVTSTVCSLQPRFLRKQCHIMDGEKKKTKGKHTHTHTHIRYFKPLKGKDFAYSFGKGGVLTDPPPPTPTPLKSFFEGLSFWTLINLDISYVNAYHTRYAQSKIKRRKNPTLSSASPCTLPGFCPTFPPSTYNPPPPPTTQLPLPSPPPSPTNALLKKKTHTEKQNKVPEKTVKRVWRKVSQSHLGFECKYQSLTRAELQCQHVAGGRGDGGGGGRAREEVSVRPGNTCSLSASDEFHMHATSSAISKPRSLEMPPFCSFKHVAYHSLQGEILRDQYGTRRGNFTDISAQCRAET